MLINVEITYLTVTFNIKNQLLYLNFEVAFFFDSSLPSLFCHMDYHSVLKSVPSKSNRSHIQHFVFETLLTFQKILLLGLPSISASI